MAAPDYIIFEHGNPETDAYVGSWFETFDLFGYFEQFQVRADGTVWLTPANLVPSLHSRNDMDAPELVKVERPPVQLLVGHEIDARCGNLYLKIRFQNGRIAFIENLHRNSDLAA